MKSTKNFSEGPELMFTDYEKIGQEVQVGNKKLLAS